jgi:hypothetical protein
MFVPFATIVLLVLFALSLLVVLLPEVDVPFTGTIGCWMSLRTTGAESAAMKRAITTVRAPSDRLRVKAAAIKMKSVVFFWCMVAKQGFFLSVSEIPRGRTAVVW